MKIRHYLKPIKTTIKSSFESSVWEFTVCIISGVFSLASYEAKLGLVFFPMVIIFIGCLISLIATFVIHYKESLKN